MKEMKDWVRKFIAGGVSRREFVERAATGALSLFSTLTALDAGAHAESGDNQATRRHHDHADLAHQSGARSGAKGDGRARRNPDQTNVNPYEEWLKEEGIPVYRDHHITDLRAAEVKPWKRMGALGAHVDLVGGEGVNAGYLCEIPAGKKTNPQRYLFEEVIYILS